MQYNVDTEANQIPINFWGVRYVYSRPENPSASRRFDAFKRDFDECGRFRRTDNLGDIFDIARRNHANEELAVGFARATERKKLRDVAIMAGAAALFAYCSNNDSASAEYFASLALMACSSIDFIITDMARGLFVSGMGVK
jgi:hypothetical protein